MTERKPPGMSWEDWVRHQTRTAQARGLFDDLPLTGRPLPARALRPDRDWLSELVEREQIDASVFLPVSITLAREVEGLAARLAGERSERRVREIVVDLDDRIRDAYRRVLTGPPMRTPPLDVEAVVERWRDTRPPDPVPARTLVGAVRAGPVGVGRVSVGTARVRRVRVLLVSAILVAAVLVAIAAGAGRG